MEAVEVVAVKVDVAIEVEVKGEVVPHLIIRMLHAIVVKRKNILLITVQSQH